MFDDGDDGWRRVPSLGTTVIYIENGHEHMAWVLAVEDETDPFSCVDLLVIRRGCSINEERLVPEGQNPTGRGQRAWTWPVITHVRINTEACDG